MELIGDSFNEMSESLQKLIETEKQLAEAHIRVKNERLVGIGEIAASMAHNMKNPLGTIRSSADIVKRNAEGTSKEIDEVLLRMDRAVDRMSRQIEDVLNFVRVSPLIESSVPVKSLLEEAVESIDVPKNVTVEIPQTELQLKCDPKKMEIVLINLILNAIQAIRNNHGTIKVQTKEENGFAIIEIEDSGPGIPEVVFPKIFGALVTTKEKGTGLGLSTVFGIVAQSGGMSRCALHVSGSDSLIFSRKSSSCLKVSKLHHFLTMTKLNYAILLFVNSLKKIENDYHSLRKYVTIPRGIKPQMAVERAIE
ncbi:MAG: HAMP domain-containing histidine kinase [Synechococcales cyanobacterium CRU_2_2]|nr:HAMP domain-containing histidine kinase [Synechococcales cyanobacterium CRU_2_2]